MGDVKILMINLKNILSREVINSSETYDSMAYSCRSYSDKPEIDHDLQNEVMENMEELRQLDDHSFSTDRQLDIEELSDTCDSESSSCRSYSSGSPVDFFYSDIQLGQESDGFAKSSSNGKNDVIYRGENFTVIDFDGYQSIKDFQPRNQVLVVFCYGSPEENNRKGLALGKLLDDFFHSNGGYCTTELYEGTERKRKMIKRMGDGERKLKDDEGWGEGGGDEEADGEVEERKGQNYYRTPCVNVFT